MKRIINLASTLPHLLMVFGVVLMFAAPAMAAERVLAFAVPGVIADIKVKVGVKIEKGAVLAVLDRRPLDAMMKAGRAMVEAATVKYQLMARRQEQTEQLYDALSASVENVEDAKTAAAAARSELAKAQAQAARATWKYQRATLRAPFGGTVIRIPGYPGMVIPHNGDVVPIVVVRVP